MTVNCFVTEPAAPEDIDVVNRSPHLISYVLIGGSR